MFTIECNLPGYEGSFKLPEFEYPHFTQWNKSVQKGYKKPILALKKAGIPIDDSEHQVLNSFWANALFVEDWQMWRIVEVLDDEDLPVFDNSGEQIFDRQEIPQPTVGLHPEKWRYADDKMVPMQFFQWFRNAASTYITGQIVPNAK